ncbi:MAG: GIY-YIG nuclease family protein [Patescibacteria group bacterium]
MKLYILKSVSFPKTYVGITANLERRLREHNSGQSTYSKRYKPWELIHTEEFDTMFLARIREKFFKTGAGRREIAKLLDIPR